MKRILVVAIVLALAVLAVPSAMANDGDGPKVYAPNENIQGMSYGDWSAAWWQYALTFTNDVSPIMDQTGQYCNSLQGGPVFFLVGSGAGTATRTCTIPAGKSLFVPIINAECSTIEPDPFHADNAQQARVCAALWNDGVGVDTLKFTIDRKKVKDLGSFRVQSLYFDFIIPPEDNYLGVHGYTSGSAVSDGYWVAVKPLSPGMHVIHFEGGGWQNVTYYLTVTP
jgi:hypothetical protein